MDGGSSNVKEVIRAVLNSTFFNKNISHTHTHTHTHTQTHTHTPHTQLTKHKI